MTSLAFSVQQVARDAQAQLGLIGAGLSGAGFADVNVRTSAGADTWASATASQVLDLRSMSAQFAVLTYQLTRWLHTGYTLGDTGYSTGAALASAWVEFAKSIAGLQDGAGVLSEDIRRLHRTAHVKSDLAGLMRELLVFETELAAASGAISVDAWNWDFLDDSERTSAQIRDLLRENALRDAKDKLKKITDLSPEQMDEITSAASNKGAGAADLLIMQGGRSIALNTALQDSRVVYYARGTSGNPCAFCAMLASRGAVYSANTKRTYASLTAEIRAFHPNCHCFPIFSFTDDTDLPATNKFFEDNWVSVTEDYDGREKLNAWRRWLNANKRENGGILNIYTLGG